MGKGGNSGPSQGELNTQLQMNRETIASNERMAQQYMDAANAQANATLAAGQAQANAAVKSSQNAAMGGILGAALGAHTTHETIKQWLPHEAGAATMQSWEMARMWTKAREMRESGYQESAIQWELGGKKGNDLFTDSQWRSLDMANQTLQDMKHSASVFGIKSASNPAGVSISADDWMNMNSFKDPSELLTVDPQVAAQRQAAFDSWEQQMRQQGNGLVVDIYKNPQLAGSSILTMKGKDPLLDPSLAPLMKGMMKEAPLMQPTASSGFNYGGVYSVGGNQGPGSYSGGGASVPGAIAGSAFGGVMGGIIGSELFREDPRYTPGAGSPGYDVKIEKTGGVKRDAKGRITSIDPNAPGLAGMLSPQELKEFAPMLNAQAAANASNQQIKDFNAANPPTNWDQAIDALTKGEQNPMTDQIKKAMQIGLVDKYGMVNAGVLQSFIPPELMEPPEFNPKRELSPQEKIALQDQYNKLLEIQVDPKLVREVNQGFGVTKYVKYNEDGTEAASFLEGMMRDPMTGQPINVRMQGSRLQEFYDRMSAIDLMGPTFPGMRAPVTQEQLSGRRPTNNLFTQWNNGEKGQGETAAMKQTMGGSQPSQPTQSGPSQKVVQGSSGGGTQQQPSAGTLGKSLVKQTTQPAGYSGAPLAAGGDE